MRMTVGDLMSQGFVRVSPECSADEALNKAQVLALLEEIRGLCSIRRLLIATFRP